MRIAVITASSSQHGGASRVAVDLAREYVKQGHAVTVFAGATQGSPSDITVKKIPKTKFRMVLSKLLANDFSYYDTDYLLNEPGMRDADIIHCHNLHGWYFNLGTLAKVPARTKIFWTFHDMWPITAHCAHSFQEKVEGGLFACKDKSVYPSLMWDNAKRLGRSKKKACDKAEFDIIVPSAWLERLVLQSHLVPKHPVHLIRNGIDTSAYRPVEKTTARTDLGIDQNAKVVLFIAAQGIHNVFKGGKDMLRLMQEMPETTFAIIGQKDPIDLPNVINVGPLYDEKKISAWYSASDTTVIPSRAENFPLVALEAMYCGSHVVAYAVGGLPEAITHKATGFLAEPESFESLREGIIYSLGLDKAVREDILSQNRTWVADTFGIQKIAREHLDIFEQKLKQ